MRQRATSLPCGLPTKAADGRGGRHPPICPLAENRERPDFQVEYHEIRTESGGVEPLSLEGSADYKSAPSTGQSLSRLKAEEHVALHLFVSFCARLDANGSR